MAANHNQHQEKSWQNMCMELIFTFGEDVM